MRPYLAFPTHAHDLLHKAPLIWLKKKPRNKNVILFSHTASFKNSLKRASSCPRDLHRTGSSFLAVIRNPGHRQLLERVHIHPGTMPGAKWCQPPARDCLGTFSTSGAEVCPGDPWIKASRTGLWADPFTDVCMEPRDPFRKTTPLTVFQALKKPLFFRLQLT